MRTIRQLQHGLQPHSYTCSKATHNSLLTCWAQNCLEIMGSNAIIRGCTEQITKPWSFSVHKASFTKLFRYMHVILDLNFGSTVSLEKDWLSGGVNPHIKKFFVFFDACRRGFFEGCKQFVGIDGCHLKGLYKGVLLSTVSIDANYGIYPLAMCVVETENTDSWVYFMEKLYDQIGYNDGESLYFMSDRQNDILNALDRTFPKAMRRYCCRHIYANFKLKFPGILLRKEFWAACRSGNQVEFNNHMAEINSISPAAHRWLLQIHVTCWAKHCFPNKPSAHMSQTI